jgi:catechol 2,3-dioxygenase-like lactoylglutathione lyase family enzyme
MTIRRAMPVVHSTDLDASRSFYVDFLGFEPAMDQEGFLMLRSPSAPTAQVLVATEAAFDHEVLRIDMSVEVSDVDDAYAEAQRRGLEVVYPITDEAWGVRRFFVRDPNGTVVNVVMHR